MPDTTYVGTEIDQGIRDSAEKACHNAGFALSEVISLMIAKIARNKCLSFDAKTAQAEESANKISNAEALKRFEDIDESEGLH